jgi:hypothetical protein
MLFKLPESFCPFICVEVHEIISSIFCRLRKRSTTFNYDGIIKLNGDAFMFTSSG